MRSLSFATRIRVSDERAVEERVEFSVERVVQQTITHACFVNAPWLRVGNVECVVRAVRVRTRGKITVQCKHVVHQLVLKLLHILFLSLSPHKFLPRFEQVFDGNDILVCMSELNSTNATPP